MRLVVDLRAELPDDGRRIDATRIFGLRNDRLDVRIDVEVVQQFELARDLRARQQTSNVMLDPGRAAGREQREVLREALSNQKQPITFGKLVVHQSEICPRRKSR